MPRLFLGLASLLLAGVLAGPALGAAAGSAQGVDPAASAERAGALQTLVVGSDVFIGDKVETGPRGQVQILFADKTELVVGPQSSLVIADYLLRNNGDAGKLAVDMLSGSFRFATGKSAKDRYQINTPTGTIGVRGTGFDVFVAADGVTRIMLYHGAVRFCSLANKCETISEVCSVGEYDRADARVLGDSRATTGDPRTQLKSQFRYAENQSPLLRSFWMPQAYDCLHRPPRVPDFGKDPNIGKGNPDHGPNGPGTGPNCQVRICRVH